MKEKMKVAALLVASMLCGVSAAVIVWLLASDIASGRISGGAELAAAACAVVMAVLGGVSCAGYAAIALRVKM